MCVPEQTSVARAHTRVPLERRKEKKERRERERKKKRKEGKKGGKEKRKKREKRKETGNYSGTVQEAWHGVWLCFFLSLLPLSLLAKRVDWSEGGESVYIRLVARGKLDSEQDSLLITMSDLGHDIILTDSEILVSQKGEPAENCAGTHTS